MKTYAESGGEKPFDWSAFLHKETHTTSQLARATVQAASWVTCAVGNQCDAIPRYWETGAPLDPQLKDWGSLFAAEVGTMEDRQREDRAYTAVRLRAVRLLEQIEARSVQLLKGLNPLSDPDHSEPKANS